MTLVPDNTLIKRWSQREQINFLLTNRIPRRYATLFMGWFSGIENTSGFLLDKKLPVLPEKYCEIGRIVETSSSCNYTLNT